MPRMEPLRRWALFAALVFAAGCSRRTEPSAADPVDAGPLQLDAGASAAAPESIAPLIFSLGGPPRVEIVTTADARWSDDPGATVSLDETFVFELGMGSGLDGLNVTTVTA